MKKFTPTYHATSIYDVDPAFFKEDGIKNVLVDLDNTLSSYREHVATNKTKELIKSLNKHGYQVVIVSNNRGHRVSAYAQSLNVSFRANMRKPLKFKFNRLLNEKNFEKHETILVGDQLLTDVFVAHRVGIRSMLVDKLVEEDQWTTRINRMLERPIRRTLNKKNMLVSWREYYGTK